MRILQVNTEGWEIGIGYMISQELDEESAEDVFDSASSLQLACIFACEAYY